MRISIGSYKKILLLFIFSLTLTAFSSGLYIDYSNPVPSDGKCVKEPNGVWDTSGDNLELTIDSDWSELDIETAGQKESSMGTSNPDCDYDVRNGAQVWETTSYSYFPFTNYVYYEGMSRGDTLHWCVRSGGPGNWHYSSVYSFSIEEWWYKDSDGDGYYSQSTEACSSPGSGWTTTEPSNGGGDCDDSDDTQNPGASEVCGNNEDDDCDGEVDEGCNSPPDKPSLDGPSDGQCVDTTPFTYGTVSDPDGDSLDVSFGQADGTGYSTCNDVYFGTNGKWYSQQTASSGDTVSATADVSAGNTYSWCIIAQDPDGEGAQSNVRTFDVQQTWYKDGDGDGYWADTTRACSSPGSDWTTSQPSGGSGDCDDGDSSIHPGATDTCNGVNDDCDGSTDEDASCGNSYCATGEDKDYYCSGDERWARYDYYDNYCGSSSCQSDTNYNSCGDEYISTCSTGDTCSWSDSGGQYCSSGDVVQDQTYSGTNYEGCSSGSCQSSSCSGSRTVTVKQCDDTNCETGGDVYKYCNGDEVWGKYDYYYESCGSGNCQSEYNYNSCGNEKLTGCSTGDTCSWSDSGGQYCSDQDSDGTSEVVQDEDYIGTNYQGCGSGSCQSYSCSGDNTYIVNDCRSDTGGYSSWSDTGAKQCDVDTVEKQQSRTYTDYNGCGSGSCTSSQETEYRWVDVTTCSTGESCGSWGDTGVKQCNVDTVEKEQERTCTNYQGCSSGSCDSNTYTETQWVDVTTCDTGDTCSWSDSGSQYCGGVDGDGDQDVVQDEEYSGTNYQGCSSGSCTSTSCSGSNTYEVTDCGPEEGCSSASCYCRDDDGDGYKDSACGGQDCDDSDPSQDPDTTWYHDGDGDGYYTSTKTQCSDPGADWYMSVSGGSGDCDDSDSSQYPGATEVCNNEDTDCDTIIDNDRAGVKNTACMKVSSSSNSGPPQGSGWIEGNRFHWADGSTEHQAYNQGNTVSTGLSSDSGSAWVEGEYLHWIDQNGNERRFHGVDTGIDISGNDGSSWIENGRVHYITQTGNERLVN